MTGLGDRKQRYRTFVTVGVRTSRETSWPASREIAARSVRKGRCACLVAAASWNEAMDHVIRRRQEVLRRFPRAWLVDHVPVLRLRGASRAWPRSCAAA